MDAANSKRLVLLKSFCPYHHGARIRTLKRRTRDTYKMDGLFIGSIVSAAVAPDIHTSQKNGMNGGPFQATEIHLSSHWMCGEPIPRPVWPGCYPLGRHIV